MDARDAALGAHSRRAAPMSLAQLLASKRSAPSAQVGGFASPLAPPQREDFRAVASAQTCESYERTPLANVYGDYAGRSDHSLAPMAIAIAPTRSTFVNDYAALHRRLAEQRERLRHESAAVIQRSFRQYQHRCYVRQMQMYMLHQHYNSFVVEPTVDDVFPNERLPDTSILEEEEELPSESALIPVVMLAPARIAAASSEKYASPPPSPPIQSSFFRESVPDVPVAPLLLPPPPPVVITSDKLPEYLVDVQLLSTRGLLSDSAAHVGGVAELQLDLCSSDGKPVVSRSASQTLAPQLASGTTMAETIITADCSLQYGGDDPTVQFEPQQVVDGWSVRIISKVQSTRGLPTHGILAVPLSLLETGLASDNALCRWFPLEKPNPGDLTRGEIRLSLRFLQRGQDEEGSNIMVPYVASKKAELTQTTMKRNATARQRGGRRTLARTSRSSMSRTNSKAAMTSKLPTESKDINSEELLVRIPRAEVISPPSSPSSASSLDVEDTPPPPQRNHVKGIMKSKRRSSFGSGSGQNEAPQTSLSKSPQMRGSLSRRLSRLQVADTKSRKSPTRNGSPERTQDGEEDDGKAKKPFLKRKPYKVVFQKLDWSSVPSKTDSRLATSSSTSGSASRPLQAQRESRRPLSKDTAAKGISSQVSSSSASIDPITSQRLLQLETAVYGCCDVTEHTASEARTLYQTERHSFEIARDKRVQSILAKVEQGSANFSTDDIISNVESLWQQLANDESGEFYSARLGSLLKWNTVVGSVDNSTGEYEQKR